MPTAAPYCSIYVLSTYMMVDFHLQEIAEFIKEELPQASAKDPFDVSRTECT